MIPDWPALERAYQPTVDSTKAALTGLLAHMSPRQAFDRIAGACPACTPGSR